MSVIGIAAVGEGLEHDPHPQLLGNLYEPLPARPGQPDERQLWVDVPHCPDDGLSGRFVSEHLQVERPVRFNVMELPTERAQKGSQRSNLIEHVGVHLICRGL